MTDNAIHAIRELTGEDTSVRLFMGAGEVNDVSAVRVEVVEEPGPDDHVLDADGANLFIDPPAAAALDDKVLDATRDGSRVQFAVTSRR